VESVPSGGEDEDLQIAARLAEKDLDAVFQGSEFHV